MRSLKSSALLHEDVSVLTAPSRVHEVRVVLIARSNNPCLVGSQRMFTAAVLPVCQLNLFLVLAELFLLLLYVVLLGRQELEHFS